MYASRNEKIGDFSLNVEEKDTSNITHNWLSVTKSQNWKIGDIVMFWFQQQGKKNLSLDVRTI